MLGSRLAVLLAAVGIAATGCGRSGGSGEGASASETARTAQTATTAHPVDPGALFSDARFGFTFRYPRDWASGDFTYETDKTAGAQPAASTAIGIDENNSVLLTRYNLSAPVASRDIPDHLPELNAVISGFAGRPYFGEQTEVGGLPAVRYEEFTLQSDPARRSSRVVFVFEGTAEYELNCQWTADGRDPMNLGCDQMRTTLRPT